jgi:hypothetical protein
MESIMRKLIRVIVEECGSKYGFDVEDAISSMCVPGSKRVSVRVKAERLVERYPMPFNGVKKEGQCLALRQNSGLYTQCKMSKKGERYCKSCEQLASKSVDGIPEYGTIEQREAVDIFDYVDPKGRKPISYTKIMKKNKLTKEEVLEEASRLGMTIDDRHFEVPEETKRGRPTTPKEPKESKGKGRPKKMNKVVQIEETEDLFASLVASACSNTEEKIEKEEKIEIEEKIEKEAKLEAQKADKEAKLAAKKEAKLTAQKAEKEAKLAAQKADKEAKLAAQKAEKEAKLEAQKAEKEAKLEAQKAEKEAKLEAQKEAKLASKKEKKQPKTEPKSEANSEPKEEPKEEPKSEANSEPKSEEPEETYKKCGEVNGKKYIRSQQTGIVYDFDKYTETEELYPVGKWNAEKKEIMFTNDEDSEMSDDEIDDE